MSAKIKEGGHEKGKRGLLPSTPPNINVSPGERTPKSSATGSPRNGNSILTEKPTPHYLKPTISFSNEICNHGIRCASEQVTLKGSRKKSFDKPQSPSSIQKKAIPGSLREKPIPGSPREKPQRPTSNSPKPTVFAKNIGGKTPRWPKNGQNQPLVKTKNPRKEASTMKNREATDTRTRTTCSAIIQTPASRPHKQEEEEEPEHKIVITETVKKEVVEHCPLETPSTQNESLFNTLESQLKIFENEMLEACDSMALLEVHEEAPEIKEMADEKGDNGESENHQEKEGDPHDDEEHSPIYSISGEPHEDVDREQGEEGPKENLRTNERKQTSMVTESEKKPYKLKFRQGKVIDNETDDVEIMRLKFKEREYVEGVEKDLKPESMIVVLNCQSIQEKKEAAAYNDMIEETASKLVEKRKSKVKALVGAFETVISLQGD